MCENHSKKWLRVGLVTSTESANQRATFFFFFFYSIYLYRITIQTSRLVSHCVPVSLDNARLGITMKLQHIYTQTIK